MRVRGTPPDVCGPDGHAGVASAAAGYTWRFAKGDTGPGASVVNRLP